MRLLILNYEYPPLGGGAGVITQNIAERLAGLNNKVVVVTTWFENEPERYGSPNLQVIRLKSKRKQAYQSGVIEMISWIRASKKFLSRYCRDEKFDLCFANFAIPGGIVALHLKKKFALKYTLISHGHDIPWMFPRQMFGYHLFTYFGIKKICKESELNFIQTIEMKDNLDRFIGRKFAARNIIIQNGIATATFHPDYFKKTAMFKIIFASRLVDQKDPFTFLKAIELYSKKNKNLLVHVIGDGKLRKRMEKFVEAGKMRAFVKFRGWITMEEMVCEYQSASVVVISSVFEAMSVSVLEALACGCFLITTPLNGIRELVTENVNASIVNFRSPGQIAAKLDAYYRDIYLSGTLTDKGISADLKSNYDWETVVGKYADLFKSCIN